MHKTGELKQEKKGADKKKLFGTKPGERKDGEEAKDDECRQR